MKTESPPHGLEKECDTGYERAKKPSGDIEAPELSTAGGTTNPQEPGWGGGASRSQVWSPQGLTAGGEVPGPHGCCYRNGKQKPDGRSRQVRLGHQKSACREWVSFQRNLTSPRRGHIFLAENISLLRKHLWRGDWLCTHPSVSRRRRPSGMISMPIWARSHSKCTVSSVLGLWWRWEGCGLLALWPKQLRGKLILTSVQGHSNNSSGGMLTLENCSVCSPCPQQSLQAPWDSTL